jgi:hypothetical protein
MTLTMPFRASCSCHLPKSIKKNPISNHFPYQKKEFTKPNSLQDDKHFQISIAANFQIGTSSNLQIGTSTNHSHQNIFKSAHLQIFKSPNYPITQLITTHPPLVAFSTFAT